MLCCLRLEWSALCRFEPALPTTSKGTGADLDLPPVLTGINYVITDMNYVI